jgi:hypothetical protein
MLYFAVLIHCFPCAPDGWSEEKNTQKLPIVQLLRAGFLRMEETAVTADIEVTVLIEKMVAMGEMVVMGRGGRSMRRLLSSW